MSLAPPDSCCCKFCLHSRPTSLLAWQDRRAAAHCCWFRALCSPPLFVCRLLEGGAAAGMAPELVAKVGSLVQQVGGRAEAWLAIGADLP